MLSRIIFLVLSKTASYTPLLNLYLFQTACLLLFLETPVQIFFDLLSHVLSQLLAAKLFREGLTPFLILS